MELHARAGRAVLIGAGDRSEFAPERLRLSAALVDALHEWARVAAQVAEGGDPDGSSAARMVSRRGRQLTARLAVETGDEVEYVDPLSGRVYRETPRQTHRAAGARPGEGARHRGVPAATVQAATDRSGPVPWGTGLAVSAIVAAIVVVALVVVSSGLAEVSAVLALVVNAAVAAGFAPSIWLGRQVPVWRWVALGTAAGIVLAWFALLLSLLG